MKTKNFYISLFATFSLFLLVECSSDNSINNKYNKHNPGQGDDLTSITPFLNQNSSASSDSISILFYYRFNSQNHKEDRLVFPVTKVRITRILSKNLKYSDEFSNLIQEILKELYHDVNVHHQKHKRNDVVPYPTKEVIEKEIQVSNSISWESKNKSRHLLLVLDLGKLFKYSHIISILENTDKPAHFYYVEVGSVINFFEKGELFSMYRPYNTNINNQILGSKKEITKEEMEAKELENPKSRDGIQDMLSCLKKAYEFGLLKNLKQ